MTDALEALRSRVVAVLVGAAPLVLVPVGPEKVRMGEVGMKVLASGELLGLMGMGREDLKVRRAPSEAGNVV